MTKTTIRGELATGVGQATGFTQLDWARTAFIERLGIDPYPGTVNLIVKHPADLSAWKRVRAGTAIVIHPPRTDWCDARCFAAQIERPGFAPIKAAIVLPDVDGYAAGQIELIAAVGIRDTFGIRDGDSVTIHVEERAGE